MVCSVFLCTCLPRGSWSRLWRALLLIAGVWYAGASLWAEQLNATGWLVPGLEYVTLRHIILLAGDTFPLEDRLFKNAAYLDIHAAAYIDPKMALADIDRALHQDPYGPDLLEAKIWFSLRAGDVAQAQQAADILWRTEGCIDCWMQKQ